MSAPETLRLDRVLVTSVKSKKQGRHHELFLTLEISEPDRVGDDLDDAGGEISRLRLVHPETGEAAELLCHLEAVELRTPASKDPYLVVKVRGMRRHASPARLRRMSRKLVTMELTLLDAAMRAQVARDFAEPAFRPEAQAGVQ